jgi:tetratricopeptide (TPR) repeat protein
MEGLAYRITAPEGPRFDIAKTDSLLNKVYKYRGIFDPKVYMDENSKRLLTNYAASFFALGIAYREIGEIQKAIKTLELGKSFRTGETLPFTYHLAGLYEAIGDNEKAGRCLTQFSTESNKDGGWYTLGSFYLRHGEINKAEKSFHKAIEANTLDPALGYAGLIGVYYTNKDNTNLNNILDKCANDPRLSGKILSVFQTEQQKTLSELLLKSWAYHHPQDTIAKNLLKRFSQQM